MRRLVHAMTGLEVAIAVAAIVVLFALYEAILRRLPRLRVERPLAAPCPPLVALDAVESYLAGVGYEMREAESSRRLFQHPGALVSLRAIEAGHRLRVTATGPSLVVEVLGVARVSSRDRESFRHRIDAMARAVEDAARAAEAAEAQAVALERAPQVVRVHERTVERQIVVARCKFCSALTPVDAKKCDNCGAVPFL
ncbi:MAG: hypothetical protein IT373_03260 [Polyangiaceae bacterium]|nr:hypothetical protein [Polyangiaceae bacterium]